MTLDPSYDVILCDLWGCVHNGARPFPGALDLLRAWKGEGRTIVFLTNAPRPAPAVKIQLDGLGIAPDCYDGIVSSGDAALAYLREHEGQSAGFIGSQRDREALASEGLEFSGTAADSDIIVCCGFADGHANDLAHHADEVRAGAESGATMICLNPDIEVERDGVRELCAGAIAQEYERLGGEVVYFGKPYAPIYDRALAVARQITGSDIDRRRVLAIGDNAKTDLRGADEYGIAFVYVTSGVGAGLDTRSRNGSGSTAAPSPGTDTLNLVATVDALAALG
ncbi:TIGR01459 family HAD-type hydrolase [Aurantiacibacter gangjinensis]|uniref:TIGR01459 family HAD-type hydrolase n=1 Tax=Aurantiacibacter gangjinensis TaxID=502682 RepID=UPI000699EED7|nr:TIGR01459 family HAD-type hydrolase [Aurantiacibacter gangjinensis]APE27883.1 HAD-superfamily subfamily IIA hydrolase, TIGR01459 [Aurantiacibacter gangjinensis]